MAPIPTVKMRVLRNFYLSRNDLKVPGPDPVDIPVNIAPMLSTDGKAAFIREKPAPPEEKEKEKKEEAPAPEEKATKGTGTKHERK